MFELKEETKRTLVTAAIGAAVLALIGFMIYLAYAQDNFGTMIAVYYFYRPDCPHCTAFTPVWTDFKKQTKVKCIEINMSLPESKVYAHEYRVSSVPHVVGIDGNGARRTFAEERTVANLLKWAQ
jgi:thiol-disulfide isomerase/thioredoxin